MGYRVYTVMMAPASVSTAKTLIQIRAGSSAALQISKAWIFQRGSATNQQLAAKLSRWATAGTVTSYTPVPLDPGDAAAKAVGGTNLTGVNATVEPSGTEAYLMEEGFSVLGAGYNYLPVPEGRILVPPSGIIALTLTQAPTAITLGAGIEFLEMGG